MQQFCLKSARFRTVLTLSQQQKFEIDWYYHCKFIAQPIHGNSIPISNSGTVHNSQQSHDFLMITHSYN